MMNPFLWVMEATIASTNARGKSLDWKDFFGIFHAPSEVKFYRGI